YPGVGPISTIASGQVPPSQLPYVFTETRGDGPNGNGPTRTFTYTQFSHCVASDCTICEDVENNNPRQQMLRQYTDFQNHSTYLGYDTTTWFINSVTDARGSGPGDPNYTTTYTRGSGIGEIRQIRHPDSTTINYTYEDATYSAPHYVASITDERGNMTTHTRDPDNHRITRTDYPPGGGFETFTYNNFGQVLTHQLRNGAYQHFQYDSRGLLTAKWNPTWNSTPLSTDPYTTYTYYTPGDPPPGNAWTDRVKTETLPANISGLQASATYEYDRDASGYA